MLGGLILLADEIEAHVFRASYCDSSIILVTNHLGQCDAGRERSFFLTTHVEFDSSTLVATTKSTKVDVSSLACKCLSCSCHPQKTLTLEIAVTEMEFGHIHSDDSITHDPLNRRLELNPSYSVDRNVTLDENITLFTDDSSLARVQADRASFTYNVTFSGRFKYNWLLFKIEDFYVDIDADLTADIGISAVLDAARNKKFEYAPKSLHFGFEIPGLFDIGPSVQFAIGGNYSASEDARISTGLKAAVKGGNVHLDALDAGKNRATGWKPDCKFPPFHSPSTSFTENDRRLCRF